MAHSVEQAEHTDEPILNEKEKKKICIQSNSSTPLSILWNMTYTVKQRRKTTAASE